MKPKPIFIIRQPNHLGYSLESIEAIQKQVEKKLTDYHIIIYRSDLKDYEFQVIAEKDFTDKKWKQLKEEAGRIVS